MKAGQAPSCQAAERDEGVVGSGGGGGRRGVERSIKEESPRAFSSLI